MSKGYHRSSSPLWHPVILVAIVIFRSRRIQPTYARPHPLRWRLRAHSDRRRARVRRASAGRVRSSRRDHLRILNDASWLRQSACQLMSTVLLRLVRLFCVENDRFEARIAQNFLAGLCPAPRWGWPPQTRPGASRPRPGNPSLDAPPRHPGPPVTTPGPLHASLGHPGSVSCSRWLHNPRSTPASQTSHGSSRSDPGSGRRSPGPL